ncbi:hypothetical protein A6U98_01845 [Rhizobium sp. WYCCWR10014]|nr:hypothetical protein A6U98_01845 [Rhizobium sp. WYCCWR10014]
MAIMWNSTTSMRAQVVCQINRIADCQEVKSAVGRSVPVTAAKASAAPTWPLGYIMLRFCMLLAIGFLFQSAAV